MPSVTKPFIPQRITGKRQGVAYNIMGLMPVESIDDLGIIEIKDRFGGPNYGSGPFLHCKIYPERYQEGLTDLPPAFIDFQVSDRSGSSQNLYSGLEGDLEENGLFYSMLDIEYRFSYLIRPTGYQIMVKQTMYLLKRHDNGDLYYTIHYRQTPSYVTVVEQRAPDPIARYPSYEEGLSYVNNIPYSQQVTDRITTNGRITSSRVHYLKPVISEADELAVLRFKQDFETINSLDIYVSGNASGFQAAYVDACQRLVDIEVNTLGNILELASTLKGMAELLYEPTKGIKDLLKQYKDPRKAWLFYRYSYSTTKADVKEYVTFIQRLRELRGLIGKPIKSYGRSGSYWAMIRVDLSDLLPSDVYGFLAMVGVEPTASNIWDLVPYSFVVDWFTGISNVLEWFDKWTYSMTVEPVEIWFSNYEVGDTYQAYMRVRGRKLNVPPLYVQKQASGKTWLYRFADSFSLFT